jgi:hypothetical protein
MPITVTDLFRLSAAELARVKTTPAYAAQATGESKPDAKLAVKMAGDRTFGQGLAGVQLMTKDAAQQSANNTTPPNLPLTKEKLAWGIKVDLMKTYGSALSKRLLRAGGITKKDWVLTANIFKLRSTLDKWKKDPDTRETREMLELMKGEGVVVPSDDNAANGAGGFRPAGADMQHLTDLSAPYAALSPAEKQLARQILFDRVTGRDDFAKGKMSRQDLVPILDEIALTIQSNRTWTPATHVPAQTPSAQLQRGLGPPPRSDATG